MPAEPAQPTDTGDEWLQDFTRAEATEALLRPKVPAPNPPLLTNGHDHKPPPAAIEPPRTEVEETPPAEAYDDAPPGQWRIGHWRQLGLRLSASKPIPNLSNLSIVLGQIREGQIWYDEFLQKIMTASSDPDEPPREWTDADDIRMTIEVQSLCGITNASKQIVRDAVIEHAYKDIRNELQHWLRKLEWDGEPRIESFFIDICGAKDSAYVRAIGKNFFLSMIARAMRPGCQVDNMILLEGRQGMFKSALLRALGGKWYAVMREAPTSKDFEISLQGKWLIEIAELDSFGRGALSAVKRTITTPIDRYRSPYGTHAADHPRWSVFAGTTNSQDWNLDSTGARRIWPVECGNLIDIVKAKLNRDQYFAEAVYRFSVDRESWWEVPAEETEKQQRSRYIDDPWTDAVRWYAHERVRIVMVDCLEHLGVEPSHQDRNAQMRVGAILKMDGWKTRVEWENGKAVRRWVK